MPWSKKGVLLLRVLDNSISLWAMKKTKSKVKDLKRKPFPPNGVLLDLRSETGQSQAEFGHDVGLHRVYVCQIETGARRLGYEGSRRVWHLHSGRLKSWGYSFEDLMDEQR